MATAEPITDGSVRSESERLREQPVSSALIDRILQKLSSIELPPKSTLSATCATNGA